MGNDAEKIRSGAPKREVGNRERGGDSVSILKECPFPRNISKKGRKRTAGGEKVPTKKPACAGKGKRARPGEEKSFIYTTTRKNHFLWVEWKESRLRKPEARK